MKTNQVLGISTLVLLVLSGWTYYDSVTRAERFERGQDFLPNLNPDEIAQIVIRKGEDETRLRREDEKFVVASADGYPASNEAVNRFLRDVLDLKLEKEVGKGERLEQELEIAPPGEESLEVALLNANEKDMVRFVIGKGADDAGGSFVARTDSGDRTIYLTSSRVFLNTTNDDFLQNEILNVEGEKIATITSLGFQIVNEDGDFKLADLPAGKKESSKVNSAKWMLSNLRFTAQHLADTEEVVGLEWDTTVHVELDDDSRYEVELARHDEKHYLRIQGFYKSERVSIAVDAGDEEVKYTADVLKRIDELQLFNRLHGSWVYEVSESTADKFRLERSELMEDA
jgi:hypothetical protein